MPCLYTLIFSSDLNSVHCACFCVRTAPRTIAAGWQPRARPSSDAAILAMLRDQSVSRATTPARVRAGVNQSQASGQSCMPRSLRNSLSESSFGASRCCSPRAEPSTRLAPSIPTAAPRAAPHKSRRAGKLEYELWCEAQRRSAAERELRQVQIHGRSRPPWIGDAESSGYQSLSKSDLMPQTVR